MGNILQRFRRIRECLWRLARRDELLLTSETLDSLPPYYCYTDPRLSSLCDGFAFHEFPLDLVVEILSRLPAKSVLRFKCVCKAWRSLIKSPAFAHKHFLNHKKTYKLLVYGRIDMTDINEQLFYALPAPNDRCIDQLLLPFWTTFDSAVRVWGSANGIVCLSQFTRMRGRYFTLWNPATGEYRLVPPAPVKLLKGNGCSSVGFAFLNNDYKLMCFSSHTNHDP